MIRTELYVITTHSLAHSVTTVVEKRDHVIYSPPQSAAGGNMTEGSNTIMSTSFALKYWSNKLGDVDIILSITLTVKTCTEIGAFLYDFSLFQT